MNLTELSVALGADLGDFDKGLNAAVSKVQAFGGDITRAANAAGNSFAGIAAGTSSAATSYAGSTGKMQAANRGFAASAQQAAEAAGKAGGSAASAGNGFASLSGNVGKSNRDLASFSATAGTIGGALSTYVTLPLTALGVGALASAAKLDSLRRGLEAVAQTQLQDAGVPALEATARAATETTARLKELEEIAKLPGLGFEDAVKGDLRLRNAGLSAERSAKSLREFGNAIARAGGGKEQLDRVTLALSQIATKGKVSQEEINQLTEAGIVLGPIMKKAFGTADTEQLQKAGINATQFVDAITSELSKLPRVTGGIQNAFENAGDASAKALGRIGLAAENVFNVSGLLNRFADGIASLSDSFTNLSPTMQRVVFVVGGLAAAIGPVILAIGAVGAAVPVVAAGLGFLGTAFAAVGTAAGAAWGFILGPIAPIALAIAGLVAAGVLLYQNWDEISDRAAQLGNYLRDKLLSVLGPLSSGLKTVGAAALALGFTTIGSTALAASDGVGTLKGEVEGLQFAVGNTRAEMESLRTAFVAIGKQTFDPSLNLNPDAFLSLASVATLTAAPVGRLNGLLQELQEKLKAAKEGQQNATSEKQITGYNKSIEAIEKQIKRLQELGIASGKAGEALAQLNKDLAAIDAEVKIGFNFDGAGDKIKTIAAAIPKLMAEGVDVRPFVAQLNAMEAEYDRFKDRIAEKQITASIQAGAPLEYQQPKPIEVPVRLTLDDSKMEGLAGLNSFQDDLNRFRTAVSQPFALGAIDYEKFQVSGQVVEDATSRIVNSVTGMSNASVNALAEFNTKAEELFDTLPSSLGGLFASIADTVFTQVGNIIAGVSTFGDGMDAAFKGALGIVADFAGQFGQQMVALGIAKTLADSFGKVPGPLMVAAGLGLMAVAGVVKALSSKGPKLGGGGGSVPSVAPRTPSSSYSSPTGSSKSMEPAVQNNTSYITLEVDGRQITKALKLTTDRLGRVIGQG